MRWRYQLKQARWVCIERRRVGDRQIEALWMLKTDRCTALVKRVSKRQYAWGVCATVEPPDLGQIKAACFVIEPAAPPAPHGYSPAAHTARMDAEAFMVWWPRTDAAS